MRSLLGPSAQCGWERHPRRNRHTAQQARAVSRTVAGPSSSVLSSWAVPDRAL